MRATSACPKRGHRRVQARSHKERCRLPMLLWEAACGRQVYAPSAATVARKRAPTKSDANRPCFCGRPLAGDKCMPEAQPPSRASALPQERRDPPLFLWEAACGRQVHARSATTVARKRAPTRADNAWQALARRLKARLHQWHGSGVANPASVPLSSSRPSKVNCGVGRCLRIGHDVLPRSRQGIVGVDHYLTGESLCANRV